jgi:hypothetical protein
VDNVTMSVGSWLAGVETAPKLSDMRKKQPKLLSIRAIMQPIPAT